MAAFASGCFLMSLTVLGADPGALDQHGLGVVDGRGGAIRGETAFDHPRSQIHPREKVLHRPREVRSRAQLEQRGAGDHGVPIPELLVVSVG